MSEGIARDPATVATALAAAVATLEQFAAEGIIAQCCVCYRPMCHPETVAPPGAVYHRRDGMCRGCWKATVTNGEPTASKVRRTIPAECIDCGIALIPWGHKPKPGERPHDSHGRCKKCSKAAARAAHRAANPLPPREVHYGKPCAGCGRILVKSTIRPAHDGEARHAARGMCGNCDQKVKRHGSANLPDQRKGNGGRNASPPRPCAECGVTTVGQRLPDTPAEYKVRANAKLCQRCHSSVRRARIRKK